GLQHQRHPPRARRHSHASQSEATVRLGRQDIPAPRLALGSSMAPPGILDRAQHTSVVTLIHGTWGRGALLPWRRQARWTEASLLATALRNHGGEVNVANW